MQQALPSPTPTMDLVRRAATVSGVAYADLVGPSRIDDIVQVRQATWFILRSRGLSWKQIGRKFNRDHTTVISGYRRAETLLADDEKPAFRELVAGIGFAV